VENVFLKKRKLEGADLEEEPLDLFGEDAVERWLSEKQVEDLIKCTDKFVA
jgi:type I restriction enzyme, R subunit